MRDRLDVVAAIVAKDLRVYARDRFYVLVTVLGLAFYIALFWVLPATATQVVRLGVHLPGGEALLEEGGGDSGTGFELVPFSSAQELESSIAQGDAAAGMDFPEEFLQQASTGQATSVRVLLGGETPEQLRPLLVGGVREIVATIGRQEPPVTLPEMEEIVVGPDRIGQQLSMRERFRPLLVFLVLVVEMIALASLVASEIAQRTVTAVLVSPARVSDLLAAKAALGTLLAFSQALLLAIATQTLNANPLLLIVVLLLGALLVTGFGLIAGSTGKDFIGIVFWSMLILIPLVVPALATLFPGAAAGWIRGLPTYPLVQTIVNTTAYGEGWAQAWPHLAMLAAWCVVAFGVGVFALGRRAERV
ncbi:MAG: ABC transporter permease subunit [Nitriliruptorales bacterium]|nr:ABC transporter permease subunit [Nitriliruptorales bacterium]